MDKFYSLILLCLIVPAALSDNPFIYSRLFPSLRPLPSDSYEVSNNLSSDSRAAHDKSVQAKSTSALDQNKLAQDGPPNFPPLAISSNFLKKLRNVVVLANLPDPITVTPLVRTQQIGPTSPSSNKKVENPTSCQLPGAGISLGESRPLRSSSKKAVSSDSLDEGDSDSGKSNKGNSSQNFEKKEKFIFPIVMLGESRPLSSKSSRAVSADSGSDDIDDPDEL